MMLLSVDIVVWLGPNQDGATASKVTSSGDQTVADGRESDSFSRSLDIPSTPSTTREEAELIRVDSD